MKTFPAALTLLSLLSQSAFADGAAQINGGVCSSQGNWLQAALEQSNVVVNAINTLKDDPNCKALYGVLTQLPETQNFGKMAQDAAGGADQSFAGYFRELQTVNQFLKPTDQVVANGLKGTEIKDMVQYLTFRKSLDAITEIQAKTKYDSLQADQKLFVEGLGQRMQGFLAHTKQVADITVSTTQAILAAVPKSSLCFANSKTGKNNSGAGTAIFAALVGTGASLVTGGEISRVAPFLSSVMSFNREMKFVKNLRGVEYERYKASVSCLVESTQESYCSLQDAQEALDFFKGSDGKTLAGDPNTYDPMKNPMGGMIVLLRDLPTITGWFQKILFGIDPKLKVEADMKNADLDSFLAFAKSRNEMLGKFSEMKKIYADTATNNAQKFAQIKTIIDALTSAMSGGGREGGARINFFTQGMNQDAIPFYLMGENFAQGYSDNWTFNSFYSAWTSGTAPSDADGAGQRNSNMPASLSLRINNPDEVLATIGDRVNAMMNDASTKSTVYFTQRMVVDPQNLLLSGMAGPNLSPYRAINNLRAYLAALIAKLQKSREALAQNNARKLDLDAYETAIPTIQDTITRLDRIIDAMGQISKLPANADMKTSKQTAVDAMNAIYEVVDMFYSRDSFLTSRAENAVRMDITDTLWRRDHLNQNQDELLATSGKDVIARLSRFFSDDPVVQRLDISAATPIMNANLTAVENLFAPVIWQSIRDIDCQLKGGRDCANVLDTDVPVGQSPGILTTLYDALPIHFGASYSAVSSLWAKPTSDSESLDNLRAKLCIQSLGFESRDKFVPICKGSVLRSEMAGSNDPKGLNADYDHSLQAIHSTLAGGEARKLTAAKNQGVCSLRTYIRRNYVQRMYQNYSEQQAN